MENPQIMRILWLISLVVMSLGVYAQQWRFWIDERQPAQLPYLQESSNVMLVNNAVIQPQDFGHSVVLDGVNIRQENVDLNNAALYCLFTASQTMEFSREFSRVELLEYTQNKSSNFYSRSSLSTKQMQEICNTYSIDALIILNQLVLYNVNESFPLNDGTYYAYLQAYAQSHWTVYNHGQTQSFSLADTLLWESEPMYSRARAQEQLPSTQEALFYLARTLGDSIANNLTPQWISVPRYLYDDISNNDLQDGLQSFRYQRWEEAITHWKNAMKKEGSESNKKDQKTAAYAAANIAIAYEMMGDYSSACDYAHDAIRLFGAWNTAYARQQQVNMRYYLEQLQEK